jgi:hypothetical protein
MVLSIKMHPNQSPYAESRLYSLGPLVPVDTWRQYQCEAGRRTATVATGFGALPSSTATHFDRVSPLYLWLLAVVWGR